MKLAALLIPGVLLLTILGIGCATEKAAETTASDPLDVSRPPSTTGPAVARMAPVYTPPPAPVFTPPPPAAYDPFGTPAPTAASTKPAAPTTTAGTHTVQKGDTLFKIAKVRYGDGSKWQRIALANPGVTPEALKVGQKLKVP